MTQNKRVATTVIATVVLVLGGLGLLLSTLSLLVALGPTETNIPSSVMLVDALLSVVSKLGLIGVGLSLLLRFSRTIVVTAAAFAVSLVDSAYYLMAVVRPLTETLAGSQAETMGAYFGALFVVVVSALIYVGVGIYVSVPGTRDEFCPQGPDDGFDDQFTPLEP